MLQATGGVDLPPVIARALPRPAVQLPGPLPRPGRADHRRRHDAVRARRWRCRTGSARTFTYDLNVPPGHGATAIDTFISQRRGYCEQFAGTFAAFARSIGLPARVAVGFTPGRARHRRRATTSAVATPTPGPRSTCRASAGWRSSPRPAAASPAPRATPACRRPRTAAPRRHARRLDRAVHARPRWRRRHADGGPQRETGDEQVLAVPDLGGGGAGGGPSRASTVSRIGRRPRGSWPSSGSSASPSWRRPPRAAVAAPLAQRAHRTPTRCSSPGSTPSTGCAAPACEIPPSETPHEVGAARRPVARRDDGSTSTTQRARRAGRPGHGRGLLRRARDDRRRRCEQCAPASSTAPWPGSPGPPPRLALAPRLTHPRTPSRVSQEQRDQLRVPCPSAAPDLRA